MKTALLSFLIVPLDLPPNSPRNFEFSMIGHARSIIKVLDDIGYKTDVINWDDTEFKPSKAYDLFIGHQGKNFQLIAEQLPKTTPKIYLSTGSYWKFHNRQEQMRSDALFLRRGIRIEPDRKIENSEEWANENADTIIGVGNNVNRGMYAKFPHVFIFNNASYYDSRCEGKTKDFASANKNFLFFSGPGNLHKGLDLLLESFIGLEEHLFICQEISQVFIREYGKELAEIPNIHLIGHIPMRTEPFYGLTDKCAFVIHPSCSEGQPGGVLECMQQGLIPIVSRESNIDTEGFGIALPDCSIEEIRKAVKRLSAQPFEWLLEKSSKTRQATVKEFSVEIFENNFKNAVEKSVAIKEDK